MVDDRKGTAMGTEYAFRLKSSSIDAMNMAEQLPYVTVNPDNYEVGPNNWVVTNHRAIALQLAGLFVAEDVPFEMRVGDRRV
jgi:hypothetical protein